MKFLTSLLLVLCVSVTANAKVVEVKTLPELIQTLESKGSAVVLFTASWCGPCQAFHPVYENLSNQMTVQFLSVDMDNPDLLPLTAGVPEIPTVLVMAIKKDKEGTHILGCRARAPDTQENVKTSILQCLVETK